MTCEVCGAIREAIVDGDCVRLELGCRACEARTSHVSRCSGGVKLKPYITEASYDGRDWSGDVKYMGAAAEYADGSAVTERDGSRPDSRFRDSSRIEDRRERLKWTRDRASGRGPITFG
jgi:hypothetical protein